MRGRPFVRRCVWLFVGVFVCLGGRAFVRAAARVRVLCAVWVRVWPVVCVWLLVWAVGCLVVGLRGCSGVCVVLGLPGLFVRARLLVCLCCLLVLWCACLVV